ncbi:hypothetical protein [Nostoc sp. NZL]|uniref:hypothetical protein n=1 Tax=Nostoc sp. NZL TaxID=2650612 RepID=UPI0018C570BA|nr:hypothetical protein [Nostoc sp. NZL]MBG1242071.1 hypothetical protein [Nostoc sp. NZL]
MTVEEAIALVEQLLERRRLTEVQDIVFRQSWAGQTYFDIAIALFCHFPRGRSLEAISVNQYKLYY